jgi:hypothetical protein
VATEAVADAVIEEVALNLDEAAAATRALNGKVIGSFVVGLGVGVAIGFYFGYRWNREKLKADALKEAEDEISQMRDYYMRREQARMMQAAKPSAEEIVVERGYTSPIPPVQPRPTRPPVPVEEPQQRILPSVVPPDHVVIPPGADAVDPTWDWQREFDRRHAGEPYVIHKNEVDEELPGYNSVTYVWYPVDEVLLDEDGSKIEDPEPLIGLEALLRFGQGSGDPNVVYVRNDRLQLHMEIVQEEGRRYEVDVLGLSDEDPA